MTKVLGINWWALALRGAFGILFGILAFVLPGVTLAVLTLLFGAYALIDGVLSLWIMIHAIGSHERWWPFLLEGVAGVGAAIVTIASPALTLIALLYLIAAWAIVTGIFELVAAIRLRRHIQHEWLMAAAGIASVVFGFLLFAWPAAGAIVITYWIGAYALIFGSLILALSLRLRSLHRHTAGTIPITAH